jgi:hypothetical protein
MKRARKLRLAVEEFADFVEIWNKCYIHQYYSIKGIKESRKGWL